VLEAQIESFIWTDEVLKFHEETDTIGTTSGSSRFR